MRSSIPGASGYERVAHRRDELDRARVFPHSFRPELDGAWTLWFGPLRDDVTNAISAFV